MAITKIDRELQTISDAICRHIDNLDVSARNIVSQDMLQNMRHFVEHSMLKAMAGINDINNTYQNITDAIKYTQTRGNLKFLFRFHSFLQISVSHYTPNVESSERLMLKYYEYLAKTKEYLATTHNLDLLVNLEKFPLKTDPALAEYYIKIADIITKPRSFSGNELVSDRYYIKKKRSFFVNRKIFYEVTFETITFSGKNDRIIAFTNMDIPPNYAVNMAFERDSIEIIGKTMPILIIKRWEVSIRPCELKNFAKILGVDINISRRNAEYRGLMKFLTETGFNLVELIDFPEEKYLDTRKNIVPASEASHFFDALDKCRIICVNNNNGINILRYLLYNLHNRTIVGQYVRNVDDNYWSKPNRLHLRFGTIPFDQMPFNSSPIGHIPKLSTLFECISPIGREHELLARLIDSNTQHKGMLYTPISDTNQFGDIEAIKRLMNTYNENLYKTHKFTRSLIIRNNHIFINGYEDDTIAIVRRLITLANEGIQNYSHAVESWLNAGGHGIDCDDKKVILTKMFDKSKVAVIHGSAGTGKSTLINHLSNFFHRLDKLFLAHTNPAVDNLKRKVTATNCTFNTITKFAKTRNIKTDYPIVIIDECSTVSNKDMREVLNKAQFQLLILVGDNYQIESIKFGNWFSVLGGFIREAVFELNKPYRSNDENLLLLWDRVRRMDDRILETLTKQEYSATLDASIFEVSESDEIVLCLNYDGLYGINNINRFLQAANPNTAISWGIHNYKVNDPVLFNGSERFAPVIYNNMKGRIFAINVLERQIQFDIELDKVLSGMDVMDADFELVESTSINSIIRFTVDKYESESSDEDEIPSKTEVPFQVAYAVSIHKAQGLEYGSVKIVITEDVDDLITHNIFYTAITRARRNLKIYWTPEVENKILGTIKPKENARDFSLLKRQLI